MNSPTSLISAMSTKPQFYCRSQCPHISDAQTIQLKISKPKKQPFPRNFLKQSPKPMILFRGYLATNPLTVRIGEKMASFCAFIRKITKNLILSRTEFEKRFLNKIIVQSESFGT